MAAVFRTCKGGSAKGRRQRLSQRRVGHGGVGLGLGRGSGAAQLVLVAAALAACGRLANAQLSGLIIQGFGAAAVGGLVIGCGSREAQGVANRAVATKAQQLQAHCLDQQQQRQCRRPPLQHPSNPVLRPNRAAGSGYPCGRALARWWLWWAYPQAGLQFESNSLASSQSPAVDLCGVSSAKGAVKDTDTCVGAIGKLAPCCCQTS